MRAESDFLGTVTLSELVYHGAQSERARQNFNFPGPVLADQPEFVRAFAMVKQAAALANQKLGKLDDLKARAIVHACDDIINGAFHDQFVVPLLQGGAGTSSNMNANEVIANIAIERLGGQRGEYDLIHPNNHVNLSQSTNDVYPSALHLALLTRVAQLNVSLGNELEAAFDEKAKAYGGLVKLGRTQLQDAVPMFVADEFAAYGAALRRGRLTLEHSASVLTAVSLGGTAIGTGIGAPEQFREIAVAELARISGFPLRTAENLFQASWDQGDVLGVSASLRGIAVSLSKICNDLRLLSSGPRAGLGEIVLPSMQPGSSIMPGKVNPVIPEYVNQICFSVIGLDAASVLAAEAAQLQLNAMAPLIAANILQMISLLEAGCQTLTRCCVKGITVNSDICRSQAEASSSLATALVGRLGYDKCSSIALNALRHKVTVPDMVARENLLAQEEASLLLDPARMARPVA